MVMTFAQQREKEISSIQRGIQSRVYFRSWMETLYFQFWGVSEEEEAETEGRKREN